MKIGVSRDSEPGMYNVEAPRNKCVGGDKSRTVLPGVLIIIICQFAS